MIKSYEGITVKRIKVSCQDHKNLETYGSKMIFSLVAMIG